ncbi:MAG: hypothetical protein ACOC1K_03520, partial [Nanoarchaeota archaeon]
KGFQGGIDSFVHHGLTNQIINNGYIPWGVSILSLFELYPISVSSGVHTLMASYSSLSSINLFYLITPFSFIQSIVAILGMFIAARQFKRDDRFALLSSFIYAGTTRFVFYTNNQIGTRGFFLTILPFFLWALFWFLEDIDIKRFSFVVLFAIVCLSIHRMGLFVFVMVILLGIGVLFHRLSVPIFWSNKKHSYVLNNSIILATLGIIVFTYIYVNISAIQMVWRRTPESILFGKDLISYLIAIGYGYAKFMGIFTVLVPFGFILILFKDKRNIKETVLIITILFLLFMIAGFLYLAPALFGVFSLFIAYSVLYFRDSIERKKFIDTTVVMMLVFASFFPTVILYEEIDGKYPYWTDSNTNEAGLYLFSSEYNGIGDYIISRRVDSFTESYYGYTLERGYESIEKFDFSTVELRSIDSLIQNPHNPFFMQDWYWDHHARSWMIKTQIYDSSINETHVEEWMYSHEVRHYIMNLDFEERANRVSKEWAETEGSVGYSIAYHRYKMYSNDKMSVYWI